MKFWLRSLTVAALLAPPAWASADVFDFQSPTDNTFGNTENELIHRTEQVHDLAANAGVADADWYRISSRPYSSYEVVIDQTSANVTPIVVQRYASDGTTLLDTSVALSTIGASRALRWENATATVANYFVKVTSGSCTTTCNTTAVYRIRSFDTTYMIPRYYAHDPDVSSLVLQNPTGSSVTYHAEFWNDVGTHLATRTVTLGARSVDIFSITGGGLTATTGSVTVTATAGYGELFGKVSQIELASLPNGVVNEAWDHPMLPKP
jgi:hypothetical protein